MNRKTQLMYMYPRWSELPDDDAVKKAILAPEPPKDEELPERVRERMAWASSWIYQAGR